VSRLEEGDDGRGPPVSERAKGKGEKKKERPGGPDWAGKEGREGERSGGAGENGLTARFAKEKEKKRVKEIFSLHKKKVKL
jgi:hypothetical protein